MTNEKLNSQLLTLFLHELKERSSDLERNLLGMENAPDRESRTEHRNKLMRIAHSLKGASGLLSIRPIEETCHRMEDLLLSTQDGLDADHMEVLLAATDALSECSRMLESGEDLSAGPLVEVNRRLERVINRKAPTKARKPASRETPGKTAMPAPRRTDGDGSIRVSAERLDALLYRSGEVLVSRAKNRLRLRHVEALLDEARIVRQQSRRVSHEEMADALYRIESGLRELAREMANDGRQLQGAASLLDSDVRLARMQPFAIVCEGLGRLVRDMSAAEGKSVDLTVTGGETEIDRSILGSLHDSLRHLVSNAIIHGIERPDERRKAGKNGTGRIEVSALLQGERLQVTVRDDGRGIDTEALRKLREAETTGEGDDTDVVTIVFQPGVTTSRTVTRFSGRGMGLDIVRNAVEKLRGMVDVSHGPGKGTSFTMTMPLTLATTRALLLKSGDQTFALDTLSVCRLVKVSKTDIGLSAGRREIAHDGKTLPALDLREWLELPSSHEPPQLTAVILGRETAEAAVLVDTVGGEHELLVRPLGPRLDRARGYNGATILPDGNLALLLNAAVLAEAAVMEKPAKGDQRPASEPSKPRPRVLVADDTATVRALQKMILEAAGYEVVTAADGAEAWKLLLADGADAVVADVDMPVMDGFSLTRSIRGSDKFRDLPVVLVTTRDTARDKAMGLEVGADAYIVKNAFDQDTFVSTLRQMV